jgi:hypothetical protein
MKTKTLDLAVGVLMCLAASHAAADGCYTIDFDDLAVGTRVTNQYSGVVFSVQPQSCDNRPTLYMRVTVPASGTSSADQDTDGQSNLQEYLSGTDPRVALSVLKIVSVEARGDDVVVTWASVTNRQYGVFRADDVSNPILWKALTNGLSAQGNTRTWTHSGGVAMPADNKGHFYRVGAQP